MTDVVLDASVVVKWFAPNAETGSDRAQIIWERFRAGELRIIVPPLIFLEVVNVAGRSWRWPEEGLVELAASLDELAFEVAQASLEEVARWTAKGLTAYDAVYVSLAELRGAPLITDDDRILSLAAGTATPLATFN